jgi:hypothetical protein
MARASGVVIWLLILCAAAFLVVGIINDIDGEPVITGTALILLALLFKGFSTALDRWARRRAQQPAGVPERVET